MSVQDSCVFLQSNSGDRKCGTRHSPPTLDRRAAGRICRHHPGLHITITRGVVDMSFRLPIDTTSEVHAMRAVERRTGAFKVHNPLHLAELVGAR